MRVHVHTTRLGKLMHDKMAGVTVTNTYLCRAVKTTHLLELQVSLWWWAVTVWLEWGA